MTEPLITLIKCLRLLTFVALYFSSTLAHSQPNFAQVKAAHQSSFAKLLDRKGELIAQPRIDFNTLQLDWVALEDFSPALIQMILRSEDQHFVEHAGVDFQAVLAALRQNVVAKNKSSSVRGASTITMQLVGLLDPDLKRHSGSRTWGQKINQAGAALWLERHWSKAQILEAYLNRVPLRGELVGMPAASRALFGKAAHGMTEEESAILAALLRSPNVGAETLAQRACKLMRPSNQSCLLLDGQIRIALSKAKSPDMGFRPLAFHYARYLKIKTPTYNTSLDAHLQRQAQSILHRQLRELSARQVEDGAVLVLDRASGKVLAWVGSSGTLSEAAQVDYVLAKRQAGSTLKPFLYAQAIEQRRITAATLLDDSQVNLNTLAGMYVPRNYDQRFAGKVSVRTALGSSLNIPAVRTAVMLSPDKVFDTLKGFGFSLRESGGYFGYSLALGAAEVSLLELAQAYRLLGEFRQSHAGIGPAAKLITSDILADNNARAHTFGLASPLTTRGWAAVKTGTSKDMRDNWCIGLTDRFVVAVWVGNASGEAMHQVSGVSGAAPVWAELVALLHRGQVSQAPELLSFAPTLVRQTVSFSDTAQASRQEWFLPGTEQHAVSEATANQLRQLIKLPVDGTILALDPDIPPAKQKLILQSYGKQIQGKGAAQSHWQVSGVRVPSGAQGQGLWLPRPGRHSISLHGRDGEVLDQVSVEVRGATEKSKVAFRQH